MLDFDDPRWLELEGGYRKPIDLRPFLAAIETTGGSSSAWAALTQELCHQGDVGVGSYAAVPHIVRTYRERDVVDWHAYALVACIEVVRGRGCNPPIPAWAQDDYNTALKELASIGLAELPSAPNQETVRSILAVLAIVYGARKYGRLLIEFTEDEVAEILTETFGQ